MVMHDREVVVGSSKVTEQSRIDFIEVVPPARRDVLEVYFDKFVSVGVVVHVLEAQGVEELVDDGSTPQAVWAVQPHFLPASDPPEIRIASLAMNDFNEVGLVGSVGESHASGSFNVAQAIANSHFLFIGWKQTSDYRQSA